MPRDTNLKKSPRRAERSAATRRSILAAAERAFAESGLAGARTDAIAANAGVNKALLYYYFRSKEALYQAVLEDHFREFNRQALELLSAPGSAREILLRYVSLHFDFISARHQYASLFHQMMMAGARLPKPLVHQYFKRRSDAFTALLDRGMRTGEFRSADRFHTAVSVIALIVFYFSCAPILQLLGHSDAYSSGQLKQRKREVLDFIRFSLFRDPESAA
jgi:TetR/AcrR family transcriptional regulator